MLYNLRHVSLCHVGGGKRTREDRTKKAREDRTKKAREDRTKKAREDRQLSITRNSSLNDTFWNLDEVARTPQQSS